MTIDLTERRCAFVYDGARLAALAAGAPIIPEWWAEREEAFRSQFRDVIEKRMFSQVEDLLPIISFGTKKDSKTDQQHTEFVERMVERGYTERQVRRLVEWYMRVNKAG